MGAERTIEGVYAYGGSKKAKDATRRKKKREEETGMTGFFRLIAFLLIVSGVFYAGRIDPLEFIQDLSKLFETKDKLKNRVLLSQGKKKKGAFYLLVEDTKSILKLNGKEEEFPKVCILSFALAIAGLVFGFTISNYFIVPVLCMGMCTLPFIYIKYLFLIF